MDPQPPPYPPYPPTRSAVPVWVWLLVGCGCIGFFVIPIIAAIVFPVFAQARERARQKVCISNEHRLGMAVMMYTQDYDQKYPLSENWMDGISRYVNERKDYHCPSVGNEPETYGYAYNSAMNAMREKDIQNPATTLLLYDSTTLSWNASDLEGASEPVPGRHSRGNNETWADGHVKWTRKGSD